MFLHGFSKSVSPKRCGCTGAVGVFADVLGGGAGAGAGVGCWLPLVAGAGACGSGAGALTSVRKVLAHCTLVVPYLFGGSALGPCVLQHFQLS